MLNPNGESGEAGSTVIGGVADLRLPGMQATNIGARVYSASGAERFVL